MQARHWLNRFIVQHLVIQRATSVLTRLRLLTGRVKPGVSIVIVNWNGASFLATTLDAIDRFSSATSPDIVVVDNHSQDGSRALLRQRRHVRTIPLPRNVGHAVALDMGILLTRREYFITLDVDAFPIAEGWIDRLLGPLRSGTADVSGVVVRGGFVHPCCLAMRLERFVNRRHTFVSRYGASGAGLAVDVEDTSAPNWDVGNLISMREQRRATFERSACVGPGDIGSVWERLVYHNFYATRFDSPRMPPGQAELDSGVTAMAAAEAWRWAIDSYLAEPLTALSKATPGTSLFRSYP